MESNTLRPLPPIARKSSSLSCDKARQEDERPTMKLAVIPQRQHRRRVLESGILPARPTHIPSLLSWHSTRALHEAYDAAMGCPSDLRHMLESMGHSIGCIPRMLLPLLVLELSKRLHPGRRADFLKTGTVLVAAEAP